MRIPVPGKTVRVFPVNGFRRIEYLFICFEHQFCDDFRINISAFTAECRYHDASDAVFKRSHERGTHALINDHGVFDSEGDSHCGSVNELYARLQSVYDEACSDGLFAPVIPEYMILNALLEVPSEILGYRQIKAAVQKSV